MKIVLDCNVLIAAGLKNGLCRFVLLDILENHRLVVSEPILMEYLNVVRRDKFKAYLSYLEELLILFTDAAEVLMAEAFAISVLDVTDKKYIDLALTSKADLLLTGNIRDFPQKQYGSTFLLTPREYYDRYIAKST